MKETGKCRCWADVCCLQHSPDNINILGKNEFKKYLEVLILLVLAIYRQKCDKLNRFNISIFLIKYLLIFSK
jgi:hypothetical protein